jgi:hypothetical protein
MTLINLYRNLTIVTVGDGKSTYFWLDWVTNLSIYSIPCSFSHVQTLNISVDDCFSDNGWALRFRHITSHRAEEELGFLLDRLDHVILSDDLDVRFMRFSHDKNFLVNSCYYALNFGGTLCAGNQEICLCTKRVQDL